MLLILLIIPTILFYLILRIRPVYKVLLSIVFYNVLFILSVLFEHTIFNLHYNLTDKIGYNYITNFTRIFSSFSDILFIIFIIILLYLIYKTQNKKLIHYTIKFFALIILYYLLSFICGSIYFKMIDLCGYSSNIPDIFNNILKFSSLCILLYALFYKKK